MQQFSDIEHQAAQDSGPWRKGNKRDEPSDCPGLLLGEVFHAGVKREEIQVELDCLSELKRWSW